MKKKLLKSLSLMLAVSLSIGVFAGCARRTEGPTTPQPGGGAGTDTPGQPETPAAEGLQPEEGARLIVWESEGSESDYIEAMIAKFNEQYPDVEITYQPVGATDAKGQLALDGPAGVGADVFAAPHDHVGELVASGLILENDLFGEQVRNEFMDAAVTAVSYQGEVYGYPTAIETYTLFYNKDIVPEPAQTFDELKEFAKTFNNPAQNRFALMWEAANTYYNYAFLAGYGAELFGPTGEDRDNLGFDTDAGVQGMEFYKSLREVYPVNTADTGWDPMITAFTEGKAAYIITGPWAIKEVKDAGINLGVTTLPLLPNGEHPKSFSGVRGMYVSAYTEYPNASKLFARFLTTEENLQVRYEISNQLPPHNNLVDAIEDEHLRGVLEQAQYAVPMPSIPEMGQFWNTLPTAFENVWNGVGEPKQELEAAAAAVKATYQ